MPPRRVSPVSCRLVRPYRALDRPRSPDLLCEPLHRTACGAMVAAGQDGTVQAGRRDQRAEHPAAAVRESRGCRGYEAFPGRAEKIHRPGRETLVREEAQRPPGLPAQCAALHQPPQAQFLDRPAGALHPALCGDAPALLGRRRQGRQRAVQHRIARRQRIDHRDPAAALHGDPPRLLQLGQRRAGQPPPQIPGVVQGPAAGRVMGEQQQLLGEGERRRGHPAGRMRPVTSPSPIRAPSGPGAQAVRVTSSPSWR